MSALAAELNSGRLRIVEIQTIKKWDDIACTALEELAIAKDILHQHSLSQSEKEDLREVRTKRHSQLVEVIEMQQQMLESRLPIVYLQLASQSKLDGRLGCKLQKMSRLRIKGKKFQVEATRTGGGLARTKLPLTEA